MRKKYLALGLASIISFLPIKDVIKAQEPLLRNESVYTEIIQDFAKTEFVNRDTLKKSVKFSFDL